MFSFITRPIGCLFSLVGSIVVVAAVLILTTLGLIAYFMPQMSARAITEATGFPTSVGSSSISLWHQRLELKNVRIDNPDTYPEDDFLIIRRLALGIDRKQTDTEHYVFSEITIDIDTLTLVRLSAMVLNGNDIIRNLLLNNALNPESSSGATLTQAQFQALQQAAAAGGQSPYAPPAGTHPQAQATPYGYPTAQSPAPQQQGGSPNAAVRFNPVEPPPATPLPALAAVPATHAAGSAAERPRWQINRLNLRLDNARLFQSTPQGSYLHLVPLNYERGFDNVTSLRQVLPAVIGDLNRRGLPLALPAQ